MDLVESVDLGASVVVIKGSYISNPKIKATHARNRDHINQATSIAKIISWTLQ